MIRLLSNFFPIQFKRDAFSLRQFPYSEEALRDLRGKHNATHSFFRAGDFIYAIWAEGKDLATGEEVVVRRDESLDMVSGVVRHLLFRTFIRKLPGLKPLDFYPLRFLSRKEAHDAVRTYLPADLHGVVSYSRLNELQVRMLRSGAAPQHGIVINITRRWNVTKTLQDLRDEKFDIVGRPIVRLVPLPGLENILAPSETAIGRVVSINGTNAVIDTNEGEQTIPLRELHLRRSTAETKSYLAFKLGEHVAEKIFHEIFHTNALAADASSYFKEIRDIAEYLSQWDFRALTGCQFSVERDPRVADVSFHLQPTTFRFDINPGAAGTRPFSGVAKFGPYDSKRFSPKKPRILVICRPETRAGYSGAMAALENGIPESRYFKKGLRDFYHLSAIDWHIVEADTTDADKLSRAVEEAIGRSSGSDYSLALVEGDERFSGDRIATNPYYRAKALLMGAGIPVQALQAHRTRLKGEPLANILGNLALQVYAKLGGTPWTVQASADVDREIVVGVGHYLERTSEFVGGATRRVVGLTTFFSSDGTFLMSQTCRAVSYEQYFDELLGSLHLRLIDLANEYGWRPGDTVRLVFHIFKPIKNTEVDVVAELIKRFSDYDIKFAFVTVALNQPFILFDNDPQQQRGRGYYVPTRMTNFVLDDLSCLIQLRGRDEIKNARHGFGRPILMRIHPESSFRDLHYLAQQVGDFSYLSWRSFFPSYLPVTIFYSNLIAEMLDKLERVPNWNILSVNTTLRRRKWFL